MRKSLCLTTCLLVLFCFLSPYSEATGADAPKPVVASDNNVFKEALFGSSRLGWADLDWEADLYYSNLSINIPLTDRPILSVSDADEFKVYGQLFLDSLVPRYLLLEAAVMPLPLAGAGFRKYAPHTYHDLDIGGHQNLIRWVTAGFEEPYAFSLFLGEMIKFSKEGESNLSSNKGYMGYMLSYSNQHIKNNILIPDDSFELEWKLKGEKNFKDEVLSWSFRLGTKIHGNKDIADTAYLGIMRSNLDFRANPFEFLRNSTIDFRWDFSLADGHLLRQEYVVGKKFPLPSWHLAFKLDLGLIWEDRGRYTGALRDADFQNVSVVLRPNIIF
jgi:hypothetical protein